MTDHPCKGLSPSHEGVFEAIATGDPLPACRRGVLTKLEELGLIARADDKVLRDRFGEFAMPQYFVPMPLHIQWCEWCSENVPDQSETEVQ